MRKQLSALYSMYLIEIIYQNQTSGDSSEIDKLRKTTADIKNYLDILLNPLKVLATLTGIGLGIMGFIEFAQLRDPLFNALTNIVTETTIIPILVISYFLGVIVSAPFIFAFRTKRKLFLNTESIYDYSDLYLGEGKKLYDQSVYKIERELFEILNAEHQRPAEAPIDKILLVIIGGGIFSIFSIPVMTLIFDDLIKQELSQVQLLNIIIALSVLALLGFSLFAVPYIEYRRRKINRLL